MATIILNALHFIIIPFLFISWVYFTKTTSRIYWLTLVVVAFNAIAVSLVTGITSVLFGSFWDYLLVVLFVLAVVVFLKKKSLTTWLSLKKRQWVGFIFALLILASDLVFIPSFLNMRTHPQELAIDLEFPLKKGTFYIMHGGGSEIVNYHGIAPTQKYALDILELNTKGRRAEGLAPTDLKSYAVYEAEVIAPCDGTVLNTRSEVEDQIPPHSNKEEPAGNFVFIYCHNATVSLMHLKKDSVLVKTGETVSKGQPIALVGNTGNTSEPHLHIHAVAGRQPDHKKVLHESNAVPILFNGRFLIRKAVIEN